MRRFLKTLIIYILVASGAILMLMPFAWMVATSFKLPSEVEEWPPKWTSKNFLSERNVKVKVVEKVGGIDWRSLSIREAMAFVTLKKKGRNVLSLLIDDDPVRRGTLFIDFSSPNGGNPDYATRIDEESFQEFKKSLQNYKTSSDLKKIFEEDDPPVFFSEIFSFYRSSKKPFLDRIDLVDRMENYLKLAEKSYNTLKRFADIRIKDEEEKKKFKEFLTESHESLSDFVSNVQVYRAGVESVLEDKEVEKIVKDMESLIEEIGSPSFMDPSVTPLLNFYRKKILEPLITERDTLEVYLKVKKFYRTVQNKALDGSRIVAKFRTEEEKSRLLRERIMNGIKNERYRKILEELMNEKDLAEKFARVLDEEVLEELKHLGIKDKDLSPVFNDIKDSVVRLANLLIEKGKNLKDYFKGSADIDAFLKSLEKDFGGSSSFILVKGKIAKLSKKIPPRELFSVMKEVFDDVEAISLVRRIYSDTVSELKLISAPSKVIAVRMRGSENLEIVFDGIDKVFFEDEKYFVRAKFSLGEVFANIFQNYVDAWKSAPFARYYMNTVIVATTTTILEVIIASMAAFAFSILKFPGRDFLFGIFLATMMVPGEVLLVPNFITITKFGWIDTYYALIVPWIVSVFAIFLIRQHFLTLPQELYDAAKMDGCGNWRYLWTIAVPLSKPVIITGALLKFVASWNAFLWVLIVTNSEKYRTLTVGLQTFSSEAGTVYHQLMAAATFSILPVVVLFLFMQKYFIRGIARTGLK